MTKKKRGLKRHSADEQQQYEREARLTYGPSEVNQTIQRWNDYGVDKQEAIKAEGDQIYIDLAAAMEAGAHPGDQTVTTILDRWQQHLRHFYEPSLDRLRGLGQLYNSSPDFIANFQNIHADLPAFLERAIDTYIDELETAEIERLLAEDADLALRRSNLSL